MSCNCEPKKYDIGMGCCVPVLAPIENYYTKHQVDQLIEEIESAITSGCCITPEEVDEKIDVATSGIDQNIDAISGDVITISGDLQAVSAEVESISGLTSGDVQTMIDESVSGKADSDDVYTKDEVDQLIEEVETSGITSATCQTMIDQSISGKADYSDFSAHTANTDIHVTEEEKAVWDNKLDSSAYTPTDLSNYYQKNETSSKTEIDSALQEISNEIQSISAVTSGDVITIVAESISGKTDDSDFSAHTANTTVHITSAERTTWNEKANLWTGTKEQYDAIPTKDANTIYLIHD